MCFNYLRMRNWGNNNSFPEFQYIHIVTEKEDAENPEESRREILFFYWMKNCTVNNEEQEKIKTLSDLIRDTTAFDELAKIANRPNIFSILKISKTEIRHSNMLVWLLDPNQNHNLGDAFFKRFLGQLKGIREDILFKFLLTDFYSFQVYREVQFNQCPIDILLVSEQEKLVIAIENKVGSQEHKGGKKDVSQLTVYKEGIRQKYKEDDGYECIFIFLTPDGDIPSDDDWTVMTYQDILSAVDSTYQSKLLQLSNEVKILISNYIETIKNKVLMNNEIEKICKEIYEKHRVALDLIYEYRNDTTKIVSEECKNVLKSIKSKLKKTQDLELEDSNKKSIIRFWTNGLKKELGESDDWNPQNNYWYQIEIRPTDDTVKIKIALVFHKEKNRELGDETKVKLKNFIENMDSKKDTTRIDNNSWEWMSVWTTKPHDTSKNGGVGEFIVTHFRKVPINLELKEIDL